MKYLDKNSIGFGLIIGLLLPILGYWAWKVFFELLTVLKLMDPSGFSESWRARTFALLGICMNIFPFQYYQKRRYDNTMRGLIFPTILYVIIWVVVFRHAIFQ